MNKQKRPVGKPRTVSPPSNDCVELGEDLVKWATEETKEWRCLFQQWYSMKKGILRKDWKALIQVPEFLPYYEKAQSALAVKCQILMKEGFGQRYLRLYDRNLVEEENENKKFELQIQKDLAEFVYTMKKEMTETVSEDVKAQFDALMNQITNMKKK